MARYRSDDSAPEFVPVARVEDVPPGQMRRVEVDGRDVVLVNLAGTFYAIDHNCPHNGGPLARGRLDACNGWITCPWHAWTWDVRTGRAVAPPVTYRALTYAVRVEAGRVLVSRQPR